MQISARKQSHDVARGGQLQPTFNAQIGNGANGSKVALNHQNDYSGRKVDHNPLQQTILSPKRSGPTFRDTLISPRGVLAGARNSVARMNNTVTEGMLAGSGGGGMGRGLEIVGGRKEGWDNPDSTAKNSLHRRDHGLSIQEIVNNVLKKPVFGFEGYNPKAKVKDLLPVNTHVRANAKRKTFCDEAIKAKDKVPSSDKY